MSAAETRDEAQVALQFSLYPLRQTHVRPALQAAVKAAAAEGIALTVGKLSTFASGDETAIFAAIRTAFRTARSYGPTVMVVTLSSGLPSTETVAGIQEATESCAASPDRPRRRTAPRAIRGAR